MNTKQFTSCNVTEWAQFATVVFHDALAQTEQDPDFLEWVEKVEAHQAANPNAHQWSRESHIRQWIDYNPPAWPEPPVQRPSWATKMQIDPMRDRDSSFYEWNISWEGRIAEATITQNATVFNDSEIDLHNVLIRIDAEEETCVDGGDLDRVIETLTTVRDALRA